MRVSHCNSVVMDAMGLTWYKVTLALIAINNTLLHNKQNVQCKQDMDILNEYYFGKYNKTEKHFLSD